MDRSFLLQKEVIEASRDFVCIRLAIYEDKEEADYMVQVFRGRMGTLENTVFAILSPDGKKYLARPGRGPNFAFANSKEMAEQMRNMAAQYKPADVERTLPAMKDFRVSLNVAACDNMPVVVAVSDDAAQREQVNAALAKAAWSKDLLGQYSFSPSATAKQLASANISAGPGIHVIAPDVYGQSGKLLARINFTTEYTTISAALKSALVSFKAPSKEAMSHIGQGRRTGVYWQTAIPVTDPGPPGR